ncbi:MAG: extradiol dioxygenase [Spirochaetae bacterium HGW-Spirochaetae-8]|jgi:hypothetical protein|nr:MAG: extradiol dioxygenase [Spirochaetae bacterium HGW-Spirochaetae-8]
MTKQLWINLPVKDIVKSKAFFTELGFSFNSEHGNTAHSAALLVGENAVVVMLFDEPTFNGFTNHVITDTKVSTEVLFSFDAENKEEVDELLVKVRKAGGTIIAEPVDQGWMYGFAFADLDGHRWNVLHMDLANMPKP